MNDAVELFQMSVKRGSRIVVERFSAAIPCASWLGVVGANGSGKTTLLRAVGGRLPIAAGRCRIGGVEMAHNRSARARATGFAPPIEALPPLLTFRAVLELAGDPIENQQRRNEELWSALGIAELLERTVGEASSGMRQRGAIAVSFASPTSILILDEPFNWLDPVAAFDTRAALAAKVREGTTLITALHDLTTLCGFCDQGVVMADGNSTLHLEESKLREGELDPRGFEQTMIAALRGVRRDMGQEQATNRPSGR